MEEDNKIQKLRKEKGLTQAELAKKANLSEISIRKYENGSRKPKIETLRSIANALDVPLYELTDWEQYTTEEFQKDFTVSIGQHDELLILTKQEAQEKIDKELLGYVHLLNELNQEKVVKYAYDLSRIPEYKKSK
jgi:transcriptional regulator with XRE-family HTH domain